MRNIADLDAAVAAVEALQVETTAEDVPGLLDLLEDESFFIREAAAWALSDLAWFDALPQLLAAYQRGFDEGHDNDGFTAALIDMVQVNPEEAKLQLQVLAESADTNLSSNARWLLESCGAHHEGS